MVHQEEENFLGLSVWYKARRVDKQPSKRVCDEEQIQECPRLMCPEQFRLQESR